MKFHKLRKYFDEKHTEVLDTLEVLRDMLCQINDSINQTNIIPAEDQIKWYRDRNAMLEQHVKTLSSQLNAWKAAMQEVCKEQNVNYEELEAAVIAYSKKEDQK